VLGSEVSHTGISEERIRAHLHLDTCACAAACRGACGLCYRLYQALTLMVTTHSAHTNHIQEGLFLWEALGASASCSSPTKEVEGTDRASNVPTESRGRSGTVQGRSLSSNPANRLLGFWPKCVRR